MTLLIIRIFILSLVMFAGGNLGMAIVLPPGFASPLWVPSGIGIAALLLWGRHLWLGVWLGALFNQLLAINQYAGILTGTSITSSLIIASGSTLQALTAFYLSKKWLGPGLPRLDSPQSVFVFFLVSAPLACLVAPTIGVTTLVLLQIMPEASAAMSWCNWWIGDSLGALLITPLVFCLFGQPRELWSPRCVSVALPIIGSLMALVLVFILVFRAEEARMQLFFDGQAAAIDRLFVEYAEGAVDTANVMRDLYNASSQVERDEFNIFARNLLQRHPEIQALEWLPRVPFNELARFEAQLQAEGYVDFKVKENRGAEPMASVTQRSEYFPILFVEPMEPNIKIFGLDSYSNPLSREAKETARKQFKTTASQGIKLAQSDNAVKGVLVSSPVFRRNQEASAENLIGFVSAVILPARLVELAVKEFNMQMMELSLMDLSAPAGHSELLSRVKHPVATRNYQLKPWVHSFRFADREWQLTVIPDPDYMVAYGSTLPWIALICGLFFSSLLSCFLLIISGRNAQVEALVDHRTTELARANLELDASERAARASELTLRTLVDSQPEGVLLLSNHGMFQQVNRAGLDMLEVLQFEDLQAVPMQAFALSKYQHHLEELIQRVFAGESGKLEYEIEGRKSTHRWLELHAVPLRNVEGNITALLGLMRDITQRKQSEEHLKLATRVFNGAHEGIFITDAQGTIIDVNPTFCEITGYQRLEAIGKNPNILQSGKQSRKFYQEMWRSLQESKYWQGEIWNRKKNGDLFAELLTISVLCDVDGQASYYVGMFSDITQSKQQQQMLELMAHFDPLTKLPNRLLFADRLAQAIAHTKREKCLLAICFLDLDGFKPINDQYGHETGDRILIAVADRIKNSIREEDSVSRHGGDEFTLLLGDLESVEQCEFTIQRIHSTITEPYLIDGQWLNIGVSSGITLFPLDNTDPDTLLRHADHAMYQAKVAGKNRHCLFDIYQDQQIIDRNNQLRDIEAAFLDQQFCLFYQPKVNIRTGKVIGVEALIRWQHPERGMVSPLAFLPIIASTELEIQIGNWVIETAWKQLTEWHALGLELEVSVNISSYQLLYPGFLNTLEAILQRYPAIDSKFLQLEILESTALDDLMAVNLIVKSFREQLGLSIALDDFGTGYSSLTHLRHLSVDTVKIDQSFVRDMLDDPDDYAIVESVIGLSLAFRRSVIAEGVESKEQGIVLLLLGCELLQGYAIAKPMPGSMLAHWVQEYRPFQEWQYYAETEMSSEQNTLVILLLDLQQWFNRIQESLFAAAEQEIHWPILAPGKCHLGRWLKQSKPDKHFNALWLNHSARLHRELHEQARVIWHLVNEGELKRAHAEFQQLQFLYQQLHRHLSELLELHSSLTS